jgi:hypothetical protein
VSRAETALVKSALGAITPADILLLRGPMQVGGRA